MVQKETMKHPLLHQFTTDEEKRFFSCKYYEKGFPVDCPKWEPTIDWPSHCRIGNPNCIHDLDLQNASHFVSPPKKYIQINLINHEC